MYIVVENLLRTTSGPAGSEQIKQILATEAVRIEQIVSHGQPSPAGFWYDQPDPEWVVLLRGSATLFVEGEGPSALQAGDSVLIPAHLRHRVENVSEDALWLAVHFRQTKRL